MTGPAARTDALTATVRAEGVVTEAQAAAYRDVVRSVEGGRPPPGETPAPSPVHPFVFAWNTFDAFVGTVTTPPGQEPQPPSVVHLSQEIRQQRPVQPGETIVHELDVLGVRHERRGVRLSLLSTLVGEDGEPFAELVTGLLALGVTHPADQGAVPPHPSPSPTPWETVVTLLVPPSLPDRYAAVSGDANPIHLDPAAATAAGFDGVIAHGMSIVAVVAEAVIDRHAGGDAARVRGLGCRFSAPVVPGEAIDIQLAPAEGGTIVAFACRSARGPALKGGWVELAPADGGHDAR